MSHGGARPGAGRPKGSRNKPNSELAELVRDACSDFDPVVGMALIASGNTLDCVPSLDQRITCMKEVAKYLHPQLRAVESSVEDQSSRAELAELLVAVVRAVDSDEDDESDEGEHDGC